MPLDELPHPTERQVSPWLGIANFVGNWRWRRSEGRCLLSIGYNAATGTLSLLGTGGNDSFAITKGIDKNGDEAIRVEEVGVAVRVLPVPTKPIFGIVANLLGGSDSLSLSSDISIPLNAREVPATTGSREAPGRTRSTAVPG